MFWGKRLVVNNLNSRKRCQKMLGIIVWKTFLKGLLRPDRLLDLSFVHNPHWITHSSWESDYSSAEIYTAGNLCFKCIFELRNLCNCFSYIILETLRNALNLYGFKYLVFSFHTSIIVWVLLETNFANAKTALFLGHTFHFLLVECCI